MTAALPAERALRAVLSSYGPLAIAVSGGIDSLLLGTLAHRWLAETPVICHAVSPAVPAAATQRVRAMAASEGWALEVLSAGEFDDARYRANPYDRCYYCKSRLYAALRTLTGRTVASGTNRDDLGDYRPGLIAAREQGVAHPFVEAGIDKQTIRALARAAGLGELAELPAQPCLSSRVETGIAIEAADLAFVDALEERLRRRFGAELTLRVRIRAAGVVVEVPPAMGAATRRAVAAHAGEVCLAEGRVPAGVETYRMGSAFVAGRRSCPAR
ncbi:hypothetical protein [Oleispirillum naphthae]|uniref:hypothetical protein n=1 Tax=Oleispirillum naphthae TaxID=2838853 RepID=UPI0030822776